MTKAEIIAQTLESMNLNDEPEYQTIVIAELDWKLPDGVEIKTCEDFRHLNVKCCDTCHNFYPHYEMKVIELPDGSPAWVAACSWTRRRVMAEGDRRNRSTLVLGYLQL
ncbi:MAG: hypothetical protein ABSD53_21875 [Terriglobales bacterium]